MLSLCLNLFLFASLPLIDATLVNEILSGIKNATDCASCHSLLVPIKKLAQLGDNPFVVAFTQICQDLELDDPGVCAGDVAAEGPILARDFRNIATNSSTATLLCDALFGLCDPLPTTPHQVIFPSQLPSSPRKFISMGRKPFQVVHVSDVHIDRNYTIGADANCTKNICCRNFADHQGPISEPAGPFGNSDCDSPPILADSMLRAIQQFGSDAQFTISTGDVVDHANWLETRSLVTGDLQSFDQQLFANLKGPFYGSVGNHDTAPTNQFARSSSHTSNDSQWAFDVMGDDWERWIGPISASTLKHHSGSYSVVHPGTSLKVVAINTMYWYKSNLWLYDSDIFQPDPNGILEFLVQELQDAEDVGQRAWIFGHIPLGSSDSMRDQSNYYNQIVQRYRNTIAAQFFGHTHKDEFEISYTDFLAPTAENAMSFGLIAPALTPTSGNPTFKIYEVDPDTYEIMDAKVFFTNISLPSFQMQPQWELYYSARESYGPLVGQLTPRDSLNASFWHLLSEAFVANDTAFQLFNTRISRGGDVSPCTGTCKDGKICDIRAMRSENNCDLPSPAVDLRKRGGPVPLRFVDERVCEGSSMSTMLKGLRRIFQTN